MGLDPGTQGLGGEPSAYLFFLRVLKSPGWAPDWALAGAVPVRCGRALEGSDAQGLAAVRCRPDPGEKHEGQGSAVRLGNRDLKTGQKEIWAER